MEEDFTGTQGHRETGIGLLVGSSWRGVSFHPGLGCGRKENHLGGIGDLE